MSRGRHLDWEGCYNVRDLGGLRTADGRPTLPGVFIRADNLGRLAPAGWAALWDHGVRTVIDLRNPGEHTDDRAARPAELTTIRLSLNLRADTAFMREYGHLGSTPLFFPHVLTRRGDRIVAFLAALAEAPPGGVAFHCTAGRDRTGLATVLLLALAGVAVDDIAEDYTLTADRLRPLYAELGRADEDLAIQRTLAELATTAADAMRAFLAGHDLAALLGAAGATPDTLATLRARLLGPSAIADQG